jgi:hypothetical protein
MKRNGSVSCLCWVIILSFVAEFVGCSTFQQVDNWKEYPDKPIRIETRGRTTYELEQWKVAGSGDIIAEGQIDNSDDPLAEENFSPFRGTIPADSIAKVQVWKTNWVVTSVVIIIPVGLLVIGVVGFQEHFLENLDLGWGRKK